MKISLFAYANLTLKVFIKLFQGHSRSKIQKKARIWQIETESSSERPPASVSNTWPRQHGSYNNGFTRQDLEFQMFFFLKIYLASIFLKTKTIYCLTTVIGMS